MTGNYIRNNDVITSPTKIAQLVERLAQFEEKVVIRGSQVRIRLCEKKKYSRETSRSHDLDVARLPESVRRVGPKHLSEGGFFSEDFLL